MKKYLIILGIALFFMPLFAIGTEITYEPLSPVPGINPGENISLPAYINSVLVLVISIAAMLAVLRIVTGGFKYMIEESISAKGEARGVIVGAVVGLILLLGSWIILNTINPAILNLESLKFDSFQSSSRAQERAVAAQREREQQTEALTQQLVSGTDYLGPGCSLRAPCGEYGATISTQGLTKGQISALEKACRQDKKQVRKNSDSSTLTCYTTKY